jgi:spermidine/putrescine transport system permease protein
MSEALRAPAIAPPASEAAPRRRWSDHAKGAALISPALLYAVALLAVPIAAVIALSFTAPSEDGTALATLDNYRTAWTDPLYLELFARSVAISVSVAVATVVLAYPMAYFIAFHAGRHRNLWMLLVTVPFWTSYLLRVLAWKIALGQHGAINTALIETGLIAKPIEGLLYNSGAVIVVLAHCWAVCAILPIYVSLTRIDPSLLEAATDLGDGPLSRFLRVTLPLSSKGVIGALLVVMIPTAGDYVTPVMVGGKDGVMIANQIQAQFGRADNWPLGAALSVSTMALIGFVALLVSAGAERLARLTR